MQGGGGNDSFIVDNAADIAQEATAGTAGGTDTVQSSVGHVLRVNVENLQLTGSSAINGFGNAHNNVLTGNGANNTLRGLAGLDSLSGGEGNDFLSGGENNDTLTGGAGSDVFYFDTALSTGNVDLIADFAPGDRIWLDDDIFAAFGQGLPAPRALGAGNFRLTTAAADTDDYIIYHQASGGLFYDADASVSTIAPIRFAIVGAVTHPTLSSTDFQIVG
jgi:Ca2+-binding RTX toxin-like protein